MLRTLLALLCATVLASVAGGRDAEQDVTRPPTTYEVLDQRREFPRGSRSRDQGAKHQDPARSYELVVRIAPTQVLRLNTVRLEYDMPASVSDDRGRQRPCKSSINWDSASC